MKNVIHMILTLAIISALAAAALAIGNRATKDAIAAQAKLKAARAVLKIYPNCKKPEEKQIKTPSGETITAYICPGNRVGFTFSSKSASGIPRPYSGLIKMMIGINKSGTVNGVQIIEQSETPGLGAKIAEPSFVNQFVGVTLEKGNLKVKKDDPSGMIDGISGATISSRAVTAMVKKALEFYKTSVIAQVGPPKKLSPDKKEVIKVPGRLKKDIRNIIKQNKRKKRQRYPVPDSAKDQLIKEGVR